MRKITTAPTRLYTNTVNTPPSDHPYHAHIPYIIIYALLLEYTLSTKSHGSMVELQAVEDVPVDELSLILGRIPCCSF